MGYTVGGAFFVSTTTMSFAAIHNQPQRSTRKGPKLLDPLNMSAVLGPDDFDVPEYRPTDQEERILRVRNDEILSDSNYKRIKEPDWYMSLAWFIGLQNYRWDYTGWRLAPMRNVKNVHKAFAVRNKIKPKVKKLIFQAFSRKPDAAVKAGTMSDLDRRAASEARAGLAHLDHKFSRDQQARRMGLWALTTSTVALKIAWNERAAAEMPKFENGEIVGSEILSGKDAPGDITEDIVNIFELLFDCQAREYSQLSRITRQKVLSCTYIREQWPETGIYVKPDAGQGVAGVVENNLAAVLGEFPRGSESGPVKHNCATVFECYEAPTDVYPNGRFIVTTRDVVLRYEEYWPNMDAAALLAQGIRVPYAFMNYEESPGSLYGLNVVTDMIPAQKTINETVSRQEEHLKTAWGKLMMEEGAVKDPSAFDDARPNEKIKYARGSAVPEHLPPPALPEWIPGLKQQAEADLDDISGLHEASDGEESQQDQSGVAIGKRQSADASQGSMFAANIEEFHRQRATLEIHVLGRNYIEPRLLFISEGYFGDPTKPMAIPGRPQPNPSAPEGDDGMQGQGMPGQGMPVNPPTPSPAPAQAPPGVSTGDTAAMEMKAFKALANGGSCHVVITPGSALAKDVDAERSEILDLAKLGVFGPTGDPATTGIILSLLDFAGSDEIVEAVRHAAEMRIRYEMAMAPNPASIQQMRNESAQQLAQLKIESATQIEQAKQNHEGSILALKQQIDTQKLQMETQSALMVKAQENYATLHQAILDKLHPDIRLVMTADQVATAGFESAIGLPTPDPAILNQQVAAEAATSSAGAQSAQSQAQVQSATAPHQVAQSQAGAQGAQAQADAQGAQAQPDVQQATVPQEVDSAEAGAQSAQAGAQSAQYAADNPAAEGE